MLPWSEMWRAAMKAGLSPRAFWDLSLKEWRWLSQGGAEPVLTHAELQRLMEEYPDE